MATNIMTKMITWAIQQFYLKLKVRKTICQILICLSYAKQSNTIFVIYTIAHCIYQNSW